MFFLLLGFFHYISNPKMKKRCRFAGYIPFKNIAP